MLDASVILTVCQESSVAVQAAQADLAKQMREAAQSSPQDNRRLEREQVRVLVLQSPLDTPPSAGWCMHNILMHPLLFLPS